MVSKLDREKAAIAAAEAELENRRKKLEEMEREEAEKQLQKLVKRIGHDRSIEILERALALKPNAALEVLESAAEARAV